MTTKRVALVTGAGSGVGRAAALALLRDGYPVVLSGRRRAALDETARAAGSDGARALAIAADVREPEAVKQLFEKTRDAFGRLDVLFNNAGRGGPPVPLEDVSYEQWQAVVSVNLTGMFLCLQQAFKLMRDQTPRGGRIINNGSIFPETPPPHSPPHHPAKNPTPRPPKS